VRQLAFEPFGEPVEVLAAKPARRMIRTLPRRSMLPADSPFEHAIARCERAAAECEEMARSANKARNACWAANGSTKRLIESG